MSENWDFYPCRVESEPASIMVNLGVAAEAPIDVLPKCAWLRVVMQSPRDDGLSSSEEFDRLCEIGDAVDAAMSESDGSLKYVGRCTSAGRRDFYVYAASGHVAESVLSSVMAGFAEYEFDTGFREDPEWRLYLGFLYPTARSMQIINNRRVMEALEKNGDWADIPRPIRHFAFFESDKSEHADAFCTAVMELGFEIISRNSDEKLEKRSVVFEQTAPIDFVGINNLTLELMDLANSHEGDYDGWETQVQNPERSASGE